MSALAAFVAVWAAVVTVYELRTGKVLWWALPSVPTGPRLVDPKHFRIRQFTNAIAVALFAFFAIATTK